MCTYKDQLLTYPIHCAEGSFLLQWCLAINNIDYVQQSILPFVGELGMENIVTALADYRSQMAADHCRQTLQLVIDNAIDTVGNKILELLEKVAEKVTINLSTGSFSILINDLRL